jgi:hypothetical protein
MCLLLQNYALLEANKIVIIILFYLRKVEINMATVQGLDLSYCQPNVNFNQVKKDGYKFVILRAGYGHALTAPNQFDPTFNKHYTNAKAVGLGVGAYWYSYAVSADDARNEAKAFIKALSGKQLDYPVYFDIEERSQFDKGMSFCDSIIDAFCTEMKNAGYYAGVYCSTYWYSNFVSKTIRDKYPCWIAEYGSRCNYTGSYGIWQDGLTYLSGTGNVDHDYCYVDYPTIIKNGGYNGYPKPVAKPAPTPTPATPATPAKKTVEELAREVIAGLWGAGNDRKNKLTNAGYNYTEVQNKVNELLGIKPTTPNAPKKKSVDEIAREVIQGKWGAGVERISKLTKAGYSYTLVQNRVNQLMKK